jgi:hypothetical protein
VAGRGGNALNGRLFVFFLSVDLTNAFSNVFIFIKGGNDGNKSLSVKPPGSASAVTA